MMTKKYYIKTYGCQMNVSDSEGLAKVLESFGFQPADKLDQADIVLVNTCVVRQNAEDRAAAYISTLKGLKRTKPELIIGVCGCIVPNSDIKKRFRHVDFFIPPGNPDLLAEFIFLNPIPLQPYTLKPTDTGITHYVTIMHGCDNFCSYCIVPYVRGREVSRPMEDVLAEIKGLLDSGVKDITLLGQNVNSYKYGLANLLRAVEVLSRIPDTRLSCPGFPASRVPMIHFLTSHPRDLSDEIIEAVRDLAYVSKEFQLPLQSGDNEILKKMNRGYTLDYYLERVNKIRSLIPEARIITDILVGFPGETEEQFNNTLRVVEQVNFHDVHMFAYSARAGTAAAKLPDQLPEEVKEQRLQKLINANRKRIAIVRQGGEC